MPLSIGPACKPRARLAGAHGILDPAAPGAGVELRAWQAKSGLPLRRFFNTSGLLYKGFGLKEKLPSMPEAEQFALLAQHGMLVKRPLVVADDAVLVGFREAEWSAALL